MDWLQFISSLAWPIVVVAIALLFRHELARLLGRMQHVRGAGVEATFGEGVAKTEREVEKFKDSMSDAPLIATDEAEDEPQPDDSDVDDPSGLVLRSWEALSKSIFDLARMTAGPGRPSSNIRVVLGQLEKDDIVNHLFVSAANDLWLLRNRVAHATEVPTRGSALAYAEQAREMQRAAEALGKARSFKSTDHEAPKDLPGSGGLAAS